jgi:hypothetical protein
MRHIITPAELDAQMAEATDEQLRLLQKYGKPYAVRAAQYEAGVRRGTAARERFNAAERAR